LSFSEAIQELLNVCMRFNRKHPEFHTLVLDAPLSAAAREQKQALGQVFVDFIAARLLRDRPDLSRSEASNHGQVALLIFRGILDELTTASPSARARLQQAMRDAVIRYLEPVFLQSKVAQPKPGPSRRRSARAVTH
jgi:hypothetical protein